MVMSSQLEHASYVGVSHWEVFFLVSIEKLREQNKRNDQQSFLNFWKIIEIRKTNQIIIL